MSHPPLLSSLCPGVSATVSCFFLAPGPGMMGSLAGPRCQMCPPPGELLGLLTSGLTGMAAEVRIASGSREMTGVSGARAMIPGDNGIISEGETERSWSDYTHNVD